MAERAINPMTRQTTLPDTSMQLTGNPARDLTRSPNVRIILFLSLHIPLGFLGEASAWFATAYALVIAVIGLRAALLRKPTQVVAILGYIAGAEVLWRMNRAHILWEYSKYLSIAIVAVALLVEWRGHSAKRRVRSFWPLALLVLLIPASILTIMDEGLFSARDPLSFNLSGHLALITMALYVWGRPMKRRDTETILLCVIAPIISITALAVYNTLTATFVFLAASNWITSGGFGPNQVSNTLGLGALAGSLLVFLMQRARAARIYILLITLVFVMQGMLTMSRGGIYSYLLALAVFGFHLMRTPKDRWRFIGLVVIATLAFTLFIIPQLNTFTGGTLEQRFSDLDTTGRLDAAEADLTAFRDNPILGAGVGGSSAYRPIYEDANLAAHTEFTRLLADHGLFGILAILVMCWILLKRYAANTPGLDRAMSAAMAVWSMSVMVHSAMRLAAIPFAFAMALVAWKLEQAEQDVVAEPQPAEPAPALRGLARRV